MPRRFPVLATLPFVLFAVAPEPGRVTELWLYELTIETSMPHLEENLRYATIEVQRCLSREQLVRIFPVLEGSSFRACHLHLEQASASEASYRLECNDSSGTSGSASWSFRDANSRGVLRVKLGGKNMTFYQRVSARRLRECSS